MPLFRSVSFNPPGAGVAVVTFHGSFSCVGFDADAPRRVDFISQIVPDSGDIPQANAPGGLRHTDILLPRTPGGNGDSVQFSLASSRAFAMAGGNQKFYFVVARKRQDANTLCFVNNVVFTVNFAAQ
jgi:hypothetical protein